MSTPLGDQTVVDGGGPLTDYTTNTIGYQPATRQAFNVMAAVRRLFGDEAGVQLQDEDILGWINDAQDLIINENRTLKARAFTNSIAGQGQYKFPNNDIAQVESITYGTFMLENVPFAKAQDEYVGTTPDAGSQPFVWWEWGGSFYIYPTPPDSQPITIYYSMRPTRVVNNTDYLGVPDKYYQTVLKYVMQQAYELDENWQASQAKAQQVDADLHLLSEEERTAQHLVYESVMTVDDDW